MTDSGLRDMLLLPGDWANQAACKDVENVDAWHPGDTATESQQATAYALSICAACPVRLACLQFALDAGPTACWGVWGATTADQRKRMWKAKKAAA